MYLYKMPSLQKIVLLQIFQKLSRNTSLKLKNTTTENPLYLKQWSSSARS